MGRVKFANNYCVADNNSLVSANFWWVTVDSCAVVEHTETLKTFLIMTFAVGVIMTVCLLCALSTLKLLGMGMAIESVLRWGAIFNCHNKLCAFCVRSLWQPFVFINPSCCLLCSSFCRYLLSSEKGCGDSQ